MWARSLQAAQKRSSWVLVLSFWTTGTFVRKGECGSLRRMWGTCEPEERKSDSVLMRSLQTCVRPTMLVCHRYWLYSGVSHHCSSCLRTIGTASSFIIFAVNSFYCILSWWTMTVVDNRIHTKTSVGTFQGLLLGLKPSFHSHRRQESWDASRVCKRSSAHRSTCVWPLDWGGVQGPNSPPTLSVFLLEE